MHRNLGLRACENQTPFVKLLTTVLKVPEGGREGVETPGLPEGYYSSPVLLFEPKPIQSLLYESCMDCPGRYLATLCVSTRFCENIRDLEQGEVIYNRNS